MAKTCSHPLPLFGVLKARQGRACGGHHLLHVMDLLASVRLSSKSRQRSQLKYRRDSRVYPYDCELNVFSVMVIPPTNAYEVTNPYRRCTAAFALWRCPAFNVRSLVLRQPLWIVLPLILLLDQLRPFYYRRWTCI